MNGIEICVDDNGFGLGELIPAQVRHEFGFCPHAPAAPAADVVSDAAVDEIKIDIGLIGRILFWRSASPAWHIAAHRVVSNTRNHLTGRDQLAAVDLGALLDRIHGLAAPIIGHEYKSDGAAYDA